MAILGNTKAVSLTVLNEANLTSINADGNGVGTNNQLLSSDSNGKLVWKTISGTSPISFNGSAISHANSGVTAGSYGPSSAAETPSFGSTFNSAYVTVNATGHVTAASNRTVKIPNSLATPDSQGTTGTAGLMSSADKAKLDSISSTLVTGVKGNAESTYRTGQVNLTPADIGAQPSGNYMVKGVDYVTAGLKSNITAGTGTTAEGINNSPLSNYSHTEGSSNITAGLYSHAEGYSTTVNNSAQSAHVEGENTVSAGSYSHSEGYQVKAIGTASHSEGHSDEYTIYLTGSGAAKSYTVNTSSEYLDTGCILEYGSNSLFTYAKVLSTTIGSDVITAIQVDNTLSSADISNAEVRIVHGSYGNYSHSEGENNIATGRGSHAEGGNTRAKNDYSHAEGYETLASSKCHAEGQSTEASGTSTHAEGHGTYSYGDASHAEGYGTQAGGIATHAEGFSTETSNYYSHAEGNSTKASGNNSHTEGLGTQATRKSQHVFGEYNILDTNKEDGTSGGNNTTRGQYVEIVGNGTGDNTRSNIRTLDWSGNETLFGNLKLYTSGTGNSPALIFQRGTETDSYDDIRLYDTAGKLSIDHRSGSSSWTNLMTFDSGGNISNVSITPSSSSLNLGSSTTPWGNIYGTLTGNVTGDLIGNADTATSATDATNASNVLVTKDTPPISSNGYLLYAQSNSTGNKSLHSNAEIFVKQTSGNTYLCVGSGAGNVNRAHIQLNGSNLSHPSTSSIYTWTLPTATGTIALTSSNVASANALGTTLATDIVAYITGVTTAPTSTKQNLAAVADTGVYLTTTAGQLSSKSFSWNDGAATPAEKVYTQWNSTSECLDFIFN